MIKRLFFVMALLFSALSVDAQIVKASFGIKGAGVANMITTSTGEIYSAGIGGGGGAFFGLKLANFLGVQAEAIYARQSVNYDYEDLEDITKAHAYQDYILIPAVAQLWLGRSVALEFGIQKSIGYSSRKVDGSQLQDGAVQLQDYDSMIAGINFNLGKVGVLDFRYFRGLEDTYTKGCPGMEQGVQVSLGFRLFSSKRHLFK